MEGIPVSLMEALSCGLPTIATQISGIPELVRSGDTGLLVPPANPQALADALLQLHADPQLANHLAEAGRALVLREFELSANVTHLSELIAQSVA
jgi:glycosyltransferase involved in cell wall biosynthesis